MDFTKDEYLAPRTIEKMKILILIFSIAMGAKYLSYVKSIAAFNLTFFVYIISVLASVLYIIKRQGEYSTSDVLSLVLKVLYLFY